MAKAKSKSLVELAKALPTGIHRKTWVDKLPEHALAQLKELKAARKRGDLEGQSVASLYALVKRELGLSISINMFRVYMHE